MRRTSLLFLMLAAFAGCSGTARADCTAADFSAAVDRSGAALRDASRTFQPKFQERLRRFQAAKGLGDADYEAAGLEAIQDKKIEDLDAKSSELLIKIDGLGRIPDGKEPVCSELGDIERLSNELLAVMREKSDYMLARVDAKIVEAGGKPPEAAAPKVAAKEAPAKEKPKDAAPKEAAAAKPPPAPPRSSAQLPAAQPPKPGVAADAAAPKPNDAYAAPPPDAAAPANPADDGYTISEIQEATRGFFGTISTSLASVIEHAFKTSGRPTAYVVGTEGGGAFLAGLRFGEGTLYMRNQGGTRKVWWHGPSIGGDFGASGSRTMFLIYKLDAPDSLYRNFTGVDGSAFLVGGVGMTVLKGGDVIMAPIRTGLGLRVGASLGYVRFTPTPTWNPF